MRKVMLIVLASLVVSAANGEDKVQWIDAMTPCPGKDWAEMTKDKATKKEFGGIVCGTHGKTYGGEIRCEDGQVEIKCR